MDVVELYICNDRSIESRRGAHDCCGAHSVAKSSVGRVHTTAGFGEKKERKKAKRDLDHSKTLFSFLLSSSFFFFIIIIIFFFFFFFFF
jgi:hypothetical protein